MAVSHAWHCRAAFGQAVAPKLARSFRITKVKGFADYTERLMKAVRTLSDTDAAITRRLLARGVQATRQRVRIASVLLERDQHVNAEQLLDLLRERGIRVSKATVYNTLNLFAERGLLRQLSVDGERTWFDSNVESHYHFQNAANGELTDIPIPAVAFAQLPPAPAGMEVAGIELVIRLRPQKA